MVWSLYLIFDIESLIKLENSLTLSEKLDIVTKSKNFTIKNDIDRFEWKLIINRLYNKKWTIKIGKNLNIESVSWMFDVYGPKNLYVTIVRNRTLIFHVMEM